MMESFSELSILSGQYKGIKLKSPGGATHPMGSREKNATFNMLAPYLEGAEVIDYFAGSGALGLEALSRGAASVTFVENDPKAIKVIEENIARCERGASRTGDFSPVRNHHTRSDSRRNSTSLQFRTRARECGNFSGKNLFIVRETPHFAPCDSLPFASYDLIISDPPYDDYQVPDYASLLRPGGILALSHPGNFDPASITGLTFIKTHHYAACHISLFTK